MDRQHEQEREGETPNREMSHSDYREPTTLNVNAVAAGEALL